MKTKFELTQGITELTATIKEARAKKCTEAQTTAINFASRIVSGSQAIVLLVNSGAALEAHTICRLVLEHLFNVGALLHNEEHYNLLKKHSEGEPARQLKSIYQKHEKNPTLTEENTNRVMEFLSDPARQNDPKDGINWEQIAAKGKTDSSLYTLYKNISFLYAHSTLISLLLEITPKYIQNLNNNVSTILKLTHLLLRIKVINPAQGTGSSG